MLLFISFNSKERRVIAVLLYVAYAQWRPVYVRVCMTDLSYASGVEW